MKSNYKFAVCLLIFTAYFSAFGRAFRPDHNRKVKGSEPEIVNLIGEIKDTPASHNSDHEHKLEFLNKDDGEAYDIVDSPELLKLHHETGKNYLVEVEAEKTPRFLFWGGNLIIRKFNVLEETSESIPHRVATHSPSRIHMGDRK